MTALWGHPAGPCCIAPGCNAEAAPGKPFCVKHLAAAPGRRGGWLSAFRRLQTMAEGAQPLEANQVAPRLWVGSKPPTDRPLRSFTMLILCAKEIQPERLAFAGKVVRPRLDDHRPTRDEVRRAVAAGRAAGDELARGGRVLSTCAAGLNRSALVAGIALLCVTRMTADQVVTAIRRERDLNALCNPHFVDLLHELEREIAEARRAARARPRRPR